jgi:hypothetical protein
MKAQDNAATKSNRDSGTYVVAPAETEQDCVKREDVVIAASTQATNDEQCRSNQSIA